MPERTHTRRQFIAAAAAAPAIMSAGTVRGFQANSKINLGLVGCGVRGTWIAGLFQNHGGYNIVGAADFFQDRVDAAGDKLQVPANRRFTGLAGYKQLLDTKPDAIAIESPPFFHPGQAAAGIDAGAHVYLAKPIAVDVPGCQTVAQAGKKATENKRVLLVDFQTRTDPLYREAVKRAQYGDIGRIVCGEATYVCGPTWAQHAEYLKPDPRNLENQLRGWGLIRALSGDVITEQNIHSLDVATWILDAQPLKAVGTGGRKARTAGDCWDYFSVIFTFPDDVIVTFASKQLGSGWDDICCRMYGTEGTIDTHYFADVSIRGKMPFRGGRVNNLYPNGAIANIAAFYECVTKGDYSNTTVAPSVRSNLTTILGRTAAYRHGEATWDEMMKANERLDPLPKGLSD